MVAVSTFDSTKTDLVELLADARTGEAQLPDFQRGWVWDDDHIQDLIASVSRSFPIGTVMLARERRRCGIPHAADRGSGA